MFRGARSSGFIVCLRSCKVFARWKSEEWDGGKELLNGIDFSGMDRCAENSQNFSVYLSGKIWLQGE